MKQSGTSTMFIRGRISEVRFVERAPYNAKKVRGSKYFHYELVGISEGLAEQLLHELEDVEGVWANETDDYEREEPHPAFAGFANLLKQSRYNSQLQAGGLAFSEPDNDECIEFALLQIEKLRYQLEDAGREADAQEVQSIANEVASRGGDAYAEHRPRLQAFMK